MSKILASNIISENLELDIDLSNSNGNLQLPVGSTVTRPESPDAGHIRYNTDYNTVEFFDGTKWDQIELINDYDLASKASLQLEIDGSNPLSYSGSGTKVLDTTNNSAVGFLINGPTYNSTDGGYFVFDGSDDYISMPTTKAASCTFSVWAKATTYGSYAMLFNAGPNGQGPDLFFYAGKVTWNTWDSNGNPFGTGDIPADAFDGNWHNWVLVNDASSTADLYYDGKFFGSAVYKDASANTNLTIGGNTATYMWNGGISNFRLYNKVLTPNEIWSQYTTLAPRFGINPIPSIVTNGLVLNLDAANYQSYPRSGTVWYDLSGNGNNMTMKSPAPVYVNENGGLFNFSNNGWFDGSIPQLNDDTTSYTTMWFGVEGSGDPYAGLSRDVSWTTGNHLTGWREGAINSDANRDYNGQPVGSNFSICHTNNVTTRIVGQYLNATYYGDFNYTNWDASSYWSFGRRSDGAHQYTGKAGVVLVWNRLLSADEIQQTHNALRLRYGI